MQNMLVHTSVYYLLLFLRYGLGSKDVAPSSIKAIFDNLASVNPKNQFTVGIDDDVTNTSLPIELFCSI